MHLVLVSRGKNLLLGFAVEKHPASFGGSSETDFQLAHREGFAQEIESACAHRLDSAFGVSLTGEQDRDDCRIETRQVLYQFNTADLRHPHIGIDEAVGRGLPCKNIQGPPVRLLLSQDESP